MVNAKSEGSRNWIVAKYWNVVMPSAAVTVKSNGQVSSIIPGRISPEQRMLSLNVAAGSVGWMTRSILVAALGNLITALLSAVIPLTVNTASEVSLDSSSALALDNPDTPIARARKPVIKTLES
jgi:hypothetical protein